MSIRSTSLQVIKGLHSHILDYYNLEELTSQVTNLKCPYYPTLYKCAFHIVEGGCFLIYNEDIQNFLSDLLQSDKTKYTENQSFEMYCHLLSREIVKIIERQKFTI